MVDKCGKSCWANINQIVKNHAGLYDERDKRLFETYIRKLIDDVYEAIKKIKTGKFEDE